MGLTPESTSFPILVRLSITCFSLNSSCFSYRRCCHLHPPHNPKWAHRGSILSDEYSWNLTTAPSMYFLLFFLTRISTTSPGISIGTNTTWPSTFATAFPSVPMSVILTFSRRGISLFLPKIRLFFMLNLL